MRFTLLIGFVLIGCASTSAKVGVYNPARREYMPAPKLRICAADSDCVAADVDCSNVCPGGGGINRAYLSEYLEARRAACSVKPKRPARSDEHTCVAAPVHCTNHQCAWAYDGPDPSTL